MIAAERDLSLRLHRCAGGSDEHFNLAYLCGGGCNRRGRVQPNAPEFLLDRAAPGRLARVVRNQMREYCASHPGTELATLGDDVQIVHGAETPGSLTPDQCRARCIIPDGAFYVH